MESQIPEKSGQNVRSRLFFDGLYLLTLIKWILTALVIGALSGALGSAFHHSVDRATRWRSEFPWLLYCLPLAGLLIVGVYKATRTEGQGTNDVLTKFISDEGCLCGCCRPFL